MIAMLNREAEAEIERLSALFRSGDANVRMIAEFSMTWAYRDAAKIADTTRPDDSCSVYRRGWIDAACQIMTAIESRLGPLDEKP
jgi:hypothetical protein